MSKQNLSFGIDFGTTNSTVVCVDQDGQLSKLAIDPGASDQAVMRSVIYADHGGNFLFGKAAIDAYLLSVATSKSSTKQAIFTGNYITISDDTGHDQTVPEVLDLDVTTSGRLLQSLKSGLSRPAIKKINLFGKVYRIEEVVGLFLKELKQRADKLVGEDITSAVIGRPVEYVGGNNALAIERMTKACQIAGFKDFSFEYEPIGAAYDYGVDSQGSQKVLIFDFGGGTLDISVIKYPEKEILISAGLPIGGDSFNAEIFKGELADYFGSKILWGDAQQELPRHIFLSLEKWYEISLLKNRELIDSFEQFSYQCSDKVALSHLKSLIINSLGFSMYEEIERVKKNLTSKDRALYSFKIADIDLEKLIERGEFEDMISDHIANIEGFIQTSLAKVGLSTQDIDIVATTGGSSLIPLVQDLLIKLFGVDKIKHSSTFTSVAAGLAIIAKNNLDLKKQGEFSKLL